MSLPARRWRCRATAPYPLLGLVPGAVLTLANGWGYLASRRTPLLSPTTRLIDLAPAQLRAERILPSTRRLAS